MNRITEYEDRKRTKILKAQDETKDKELDGCTFKPDMVTAKPEGQARTLDQFLQDQSKFVENVKAKNENTAKGAHERDSTFEKPMIDANSRKMAEDK